MAPRRSSRCRITKAYSRSRPPGPQGSTLRGSEASQARYSRRASCHATSPGDAGWCSVRSPLPPRYLLVATEKVCNGRVSRLTQSSSSPSPAAGAQSRSVVTKRGDLGPLSANMLTRLLWRAGTHTAKINVLFPHRGDHLHPHQPARSTDCADGNATAARRVIGEPVCRVTSELPLMLLRQMRQLKPRFLPCSRLQGGLRRRGEIVHVAHTPRWRVERGP